MSRVGDYRDRMTLPEVSDADIERLLSGGTAPAGLDDVEDFLAAMRSHAATVPPSAQVERFAVNAAAVARAGKRPVIVPTPERRPLWMKLQNHMAAATASVVAVLAISGLGLAADASVPGDFLYDLDLAMEHVGIGAGSTAERLDEAGVLLDRDDTLGAFALLDQVTEGDVDLGTLVEALAADGPVAAHDRVSDLLEFISSNAGDGVGLDGQEFGQAVAAIARGNSDGPTADEDETSSGTPGNSDSSNAGGNAQTGEHPANSGNASNGNGQNDGAPGNSENSNGVNGQSEDVGGTGSVDDPSPAPEPGTGSGNGNGQGADPPGNSGNSNAGGNGQGKDKP